MRGIQPLKAVSGAGGASTAAPAQPRVVFGMPAYGRPDSLPRTLESLLSQTCGDFAIVIVDDHPSPEVLKIVETYAALDPRITYEPNPVRLGMIGNWRNAFVRSQAIHPGGAYFAWVSDHDIWHPRWLEVLVQVLDEAPEVVLAYPQMQRVYANNERRRITALFDTVAARGRGARVRETAFRMTAGNAIYGLFRTTALAQAGVFRPVVMPDRQVLVELSILGSFRHVPEILWYREVAGVFSYARQRRMFFIDRVPLHTWLPACLQHWGVLVWDFVIRGRGRPQVGRLAGGWFAAVALWYSAARDLRRDDAQWRLSLRKTPLGRWV